MKYEITSIVNLFGIDVKDSYVEEFDNDENVFGRVLKYHQRMYRAFPHCEFKLAEAKEIK